ncbi:MAG: S41 family peptidase [Bacteroidaceae bacterium]|nr:S41 family peptidase [Bacteroidaceae bacterium]
MNTTFLRKALLAAAATLAALAPARAQQRQQTGFDISRNLDIFADIYRQLDMFYVDSLSADTAVEWAINGMLAEIDPYTKYYPDEDQEELRMMATGRYAGIGALIRMPKGSKRAIIEEPYEGQPAQQAGVKAGDVILSIDGRDVEGWEISRVSKTLRGEPGTTFELRVQRPSERKPRAFKITRRQVQLPCLPWYGIVDDEAHVGYIYLSEFTDKCSREVRHAILDMKQQGMQRLIFDLRDNGGGSVSEAVEIVGMFVPRGSLVVKTKGKLPSTCHDYLTPAEPIDTLMPLAVMINSNTASASEIVAGALQDLDRAIIVGQRSYGKGLVQGIRELPYRGQLKITTARYYIPSGRCIQAYDYRHRTADGAATTLPDSLTREFHTRLGRTVRDGGGIQPDSVLAVDSVPSMVYDLTASDPFFDFATDYALQHPQVAPPASFKLTDAEWDAFAEKIESSDFTYNGRTATALKQLRQLARFEGYEEETRDEFEALEAKLKTNDLAADLQRFRQHIQPYLETEIVSRYYYQSGALRHTLSFDKALEKTIGILKSEK